MTTRIAGSLSPSPELRAVLGALGAMATRDPLHAAAYAPLGHEIALADAVEWDEAFGRPLPDDALILAALRIPLLDRALGAIADAPIDLPRVDDDEWIGVWSADPFAMHVESEAATYQRVLDMTICLAAKGTPGDPRVLVVTAGEPEDEEAVPRPTRLSKFLLARLDEHFSLSATGETLSQSERDEGRARRAAWKLARADTPSDLEVDALFGASVAGEMAPAFRPVRVMHPKLGPGTMIGLVEDTAEVVFDAGGTKKIKRSYLTEGHG